MKLDPLLNPAEVSAFLGVPVGTIYAWRSRGVGPEGIRVGRHLRFRRGEIERWLEAGGDCPSRQASSRPQRRKGHK
jgi:excisionase family DNA binding protein